MRDHGYRKRILSVFMAAVLFAGTAVFPGHIYADQNGVSVNEAAVSANPASISQNGDPEAVSQNEDVGEQNPGGSESGGSTEEGSISSGSTEAGSVSSVSSGNTEAGTVSEDALSVNTVSADEKADAAMSVTSDEYIEIGALDDDTPIESPEPLPEFETTLTEGEEPPAGAKKGRKTEPESEPAAGAQEYAVSYNSLAQGLLPTGFKIDQDPSSLCWAFTAAMLGEISLIKQGLVSRDNVHFSADQIGYFFYNRTNDPLGNTAEDFNTVLGSDYYKRGGNNSFNTWSLASWISPRDEDEMPFTRAKYTNVNTNKAYYSKAHLQDAYWTSVYTPSANDLSYITDVKELIYDHGGVSVIIYSGRKISSNNTVYDTVASGGHNVTFIGWDDNFPKERFAKEPPGNGAWYVRDSYDNTPNMDENGCFWMSYYDRSITYSESGKAIAFDFEKGDNYDYCYQYDGAAGNHIITSKQKNIRVANVFRSQGDETLKAVGFAPASVSMSYTVNIYKLNEGYSTPINGASLSTVSGNTRFVGYRTIKLNDPVLLTEGDIFSVVIDAEDTSGDDYAMIFKEDSYTNGGWVDFTSHVDEKQSYYYNTDLKSYNCSVRIKAYTSATEKVARPLLKETSFEYDGSSQTPEPEVRRGEAGKGALLKKDNDYTVSYGENILPGTGTVTVSSNTYRIVDPELTFTITNRSVNNSTVKAVLSENTFEYDKTAHEPKVTVTDEAPGMSPEEGRDYTVSYEDNVNAGTAYAVIKGTGYYKDEKKVPFTINRISLEDFDISKIPDCTYTGNPCEPDITITDKNGEKLQKGEDYDLTCSDNINVGTATVEVNGRGNYKGTKTLDFKIVPKNVNELTVKGLESVYPYTGSPIKPEISIVDEKTGKVLAKDTDYTVDYKNNTKEGRALVVITGLGNYTGVNEKEFYISGSDPLPIKIGRISDKTYVPGDEPVTPALTVKHGSLTLNPGSDYTVSFEGNDAAGTATAIVKGVRGTVYDNSSTQAPFTIKPFDIKKAKVSGIGDRLFEQGKEYTVSENLTVISPSTGKTVTLKQGTDYFVNLENSTGYKVNQQVKVYITGTGNYTGKITKTFRLRSYIPMSDEEVFDISVSPNTFKYDGRAKKPEVTVIRRADGKALTSGTDYKVTYASNKNAGLARVTVKPTKSYSKAENVKGSAVIPFVIEGKTPGEVTISAINDKVYTGKPIKPALKVYDDQKKIPKSCYYVEYCDNVNAGTAKIIIHGKKNYSGVLGTFEFNINKQSFSKVKISYTKSSGVLKVRYGNAVMRENIDYEHDADSRLITSLETNFEAGSKNY